MESSTTETRRTALHSRRTASEPATAPDTHADLHLVNSESRYSKAPFTKSSPHGYIHIGAAVRPRSLPLTLLPAGREKAELIGRLKERAQQLEQFENVETATVFEAVGMPPLHRLPYIRERTDSLHLARFDVVVLVETSSPATARDVQETPPYRALVDALRSKATDMHIMAARNETRLGDVDKTNDGLFIFNHFVADDAGVLLELFDYLAGWYVAEIGLDNSTLLVPLNDEDADYVAVNNARWDLSLPRFLWKQVSKKSFREFVLANLAANRAGAMPVLYRLA